MQKRGISPNKVTVVSILDTCASKESRTTGLWMHIYILSSGFKPDIVVWNALMKMYGRCGNLEDAKKVFRNLPERDTSSWNAMILAYNEHGQAKQAFQLFYLMQTEEILPNKDTFVCILAACTILTDLAVGRCIHTLLFGWGLEPDAVLRTSLVIMYGSCGSLKDAHEVFNKMLKHDVIAWNAMIGLCAGYGEVNEALLLFDRMNLEGVMANKVTFISMLAACANQAALDEGERIRAHIQDSSFKADVAVGNALLNMYGKCGCLKEARIMFEKLPQRDVISWNSMITVHAQHGLGREALRLLDQMQWEGITPDEVTFVSVLGACSHAGLLDEGCHIFTSMNTDYGMSMIVDHYICMIDLLGRAGQVNEAEDLMKNMQFLPTAASLTASISACKYRVFLE